MIKVIENDVPVVKYSQLAPGDLFKWPDYPLVGQPIFLKLQGDKYTALTRGTIPPPCGFWIDPGEICSRLAKDEIILLDGTLTISNRKNEN